MTDYASIDTTSDPTWKKLYYAGGIASILTGIMYIAATLLLFATPLQPANGGVATLEYIASNRTVYIVEQLLYNAPVFLALVVFLALYFALRNVDKSYAAIGSLFGIGSEVASLLIFNTIAGLLYLSDAYVGATNDAERLMFSTASEALLAQYNIAYAAGVLTALSILILSMVMLRGVFSKRVAYFGIVTGVLGVISEGLRTVLGPAYAIFGILLMIWYIIIGRELLLLQNG